MDRFNWDHTFSPTLLNHFAFGYLNRNEGYGSVNYQFANDLTWAGGPGFLAVLSDKHTLSLQAIVSGETKARDTFMGMKADDTGITSVFLGPQINYAWSDKLSLELGVEVPVVLRNTDLQSVPDYRVRGAFTWHF